MNMTTTQEPGPLVKKLLLNWDSHRTGCLRPLVVQMDGKTLGVAILPVSYQLNLKLFAKALGAKKAAMADKKLVEKTTGYVLGGVSPLGQKKKLATVMHESAKAFDTVFVSAGKRGLDIELGPDDLVAITNGEYALICE